MTEYEVSTALGLALEDVRRRHPNQWRAAESVLAKPLDRELAMAKLTEDAEFQALSARTSQETSILTLANGIVPILIRFLGTVLAD